ncbi:MAG: hypothetical protein H8E55_61750 [Pelagibacterales bacterium]|nr:hypothetical protein [Pelagibacterales bacterium]
MNSVYDFIIKPINKRYNNTKKVNDKELVLNTKIEDFKAVSKEAVVVGIPTAFSTDIQIGDRVIIHHNVFRRFYDMKGREKNSRSYFKEDLYFCAADQIYLYKKDKEWLSFMDRCFVSPIQNTNPLYNRKREPNTGVLKYDNIYLNKLGIYKDMLISFKPVGEFEFVINGKLLYCMKSNDIVIKHEYEGNEKEYNPSWANSS